MSTPTFIKNLSRHPKILIAMQKDFFSRKMKTQITPPPKKIKQSIIDRAEPDNKTQVSIIIPVYNVEQHLKKCLDSVYNQKVTISLEILIINDCSPDNSKLILDNYKNRANTKIITLKKNVGLSGARNRGLNIAKGKYITFLDSDDILTDGAIQHLYNLAENNNADIVEGNFTRFIHDTELDNKQSEKTYDSFILKDPVDITKTGTGYAWGKLYKRDMFRQINFPEGLVFEDQIIKPLLLKFAKTYIKTTKPVVHYRKNENSITCVSDKKNYGLDHFESMQYTLETIKELNLPIDNLTYTLMLHDATKLLHGRTKTLSFEIKAYMVSESRKILKYLEKELDNPLTLTGYQKVARFSIYHMRLNTWARISPFL